MSELPVVADPSVSEAELLPSELPLSVALRQATELAHQQAEQSPFMERLLAGEGTAGGFVALTAQLQPIYQALEKALAAASDTHLIAGVDDPRLLRSQRLEADLVALLGESWRSRPVAVVLPATQAYVDHLSGPIHPVQLVAHHYVRYLGDLSGGQIIARLVERHYGVGEQALSFYRFDGIDKPKVFKDHYRARLDALQLEPDERDLLLAEAVRSFELNRAIFANLADLPADSTVD